MGLTAACVPRGTRCNTCSSAGGAVAIRAAGGAPCSVRGVCQTTQCASGNAHCNDDARNAQRSRRKRHCAVHALSDDEHAQLAAHATSLAAPAPATLTVQRRTGQKATAGAALSAHMMVAQTRSLPGSMHRAMRQTAVCMLHRQHTARAVQPRSSLTWKLRQTRLQRAPPVMHLQQA